MSIRSILQVFAIVFAIVLGAGGLSWASDDAASDGTAPVEAAPPADASDTPDAADADDGADDGATDDAADDKADQ